MKNSCIRHRLEILFFFIFLFLFFHGTSRSYPDIPDDNLAYPVLLVSKDGGSGSGFFYNKDDASYLITARHVLFKETTLRVRERFVVPKPLRHKLFCEEDKLRKEFVLTFCGVMSQEDRDELMRADSAQGHFNFKEAIEKLYEDSQKLKLRNDEITLFSNVPSRFGGKGINEIELKLTKLLETGHISYHPSHDVAYIRIGISKKVGEQDQIDLLGGVTKKQGSGFIGVAKDNFKLLKDVYVGNQVFVFGYPTSITRIDPWLDISLPLLRKGIIAGINNDLKAVILDCPVFQGNSGGLVIEVEEKSFKEIKYRAIGLVTNFVPYKKKWFQNSGYSVVVPMDFVNDLIALGESGSPLDKGQTNAK
ncbi:trypsin-like peptidase domain-containing protein [bacterium]|nr:trypsin-like peptidase domain-containing protein [bacterium]